MGRYQTKQSARKKVNERLCKFCDKGVLEDEKHVIMSCILYNTHRKVMLKEIIEVFPGLATADTDELFEFIMQCRDYEVFKHFIPMLDNVKNLRGEL